MKTCVWLLLVVCLIAPAAAAQEETVHPKFEVKSFDLGEDGYWTEQPSGPGSFLAYSYALLATGFCLGPVFKNAKRTHLD